MCREVLAQDQLGAGAECRLAVPAEATFGSEKRLLALRKRLQGALRRYRPDNILVSHAEIIIRFETDTCIGPACDKAEKILHQFSVEPVHPRVLEDALAITNRERLSWTKAGLLQIYGYGFFFEWEPEGTVPLLRCAAGA